MERKNKLISFLIILFGVLIIGVIFSFFMKDNKLISTKSIEVVFNVTKDELGFNLNASILDFGRIPIGASSQRNIMLKNFYSDSVLVKISFSKELDGFFDESSIYLAKGEERNVSLTIQVPIYSEIGFRKGKIFIQVFRV